MMNGSQTASQTNRWQRMADVVNQYPHLLQSNLLQENKKIFIYRLVSENLLVFLLQYVGLTVSTLSSHLSPVWFASGTACAFIFLRGVTVLPGIWLGTLLSYCMAKATLGQGVACATIFSLQAFVLLMLSYRFVAPTLIFYRRSSWVKFVMCSLALTALSSVALLFFCFSSLQSSEGFFQLALSWWLANFNGLVIFSCSIIAWDAYFSQMDLLKQKNKVLLLMLYGLLLILSVFAFTPYASLVGVGIFLLTIVMSVFYGWCGAVSALFLVSLLLTLEMNFGFLSTTATSMVTLLLCQMLLCLSAIVGLFVAI